MSNQPLAHDELNHKDLMLKSPLLLSDNNGENNNSTSAKEIELNLLKPPPKPSRIEDHNDHDRNNVYEKVVSPISTSPSVAAASPVNHHDKKKAAPVVASMPSEPLSWREARARMREILQQYINDRSFLRNISTATANPTSAAASQSEVNHGEGFLTKSCGFLSWLSSYDLDCYCGSVLCSVVLLIMSSSFFALVQGQKHNNNTTAHVEYSLSIHRSYMISSIIFTFTSILSLWSIRRRKQTSILEINLKRRKNVSLLIQELNSLERAHDQQEQEQSPSLHNYNNRIPGQNALSDVYLVYRLSPSTSGKRRDKGQWHRIPSLLLVEGDFIALQTGDIAPADCKLVTGSRFGSLARASETLDAKNNQNPITSAAADTTPSKTPPRVRDVKVIKAGDKIKPLFIRKRPDQARNSIQSAIPWFPPGKSTLPEKSRKLLHLCNNKRVFEVLEAPMSKFLRSGTVSYQSPRIHRKLREVRNVMFLLSIVMFIFTLIVVATRHGVNITDQRHHFYLPLLAALSILPTVIPLILFIQEIIGTIHILQFVHTLQSMSTIGTPHDPDLNDEKSERPLQLFLRYFIQGCRSRFSLAYGSSFLPRDEDLIHFPPSSMCLYEKLGLVTASVFIDDELICDPMSTPEQLLIPSSNGLKLLDLFPKHELNREDEISDNGNDENWSDRWGYNLRSFKEKGLKRFLASASDDSDSDWDEDIHQQTTTTNKKHLSALRRRCHKSRHSKSNNANRKQDSKIEIQFEDPLWWRYLPSLKCIGLSCLLLNEEQKNKENKSENKSRKVGLNKEVGDDEQSDDNRFRYFHGQAESALVDEVCHFHDRNHLYLVAKCIGFTVEPNMIGEKGDITPFEEQKRIHVIATRLLQDRAQLDRYEIGQHESRTWGMLQPDSTSILIKDNRSGAHQLLTIGDSRVVSDFCTVSWQGGISTISPLSPADRREILENAKNWNLADLDVTAFSYAPIPCSHEPKIGTNCEAYLVDNRSTNEVPASIQSEDWGFLKNQIFLGLLGSSVSSRKCISPIIEEFDSAGVRFVYFSSRNMRRTKEVASEMGIDVAWNCAISLRPLDEDGDDDYHMDTFGMADFNAKLPHGVDAVIRHLKDVDNVPLLVRLYTDVTKKSTAEMVQIFREHSDTVLTIGLSHVSHNDEIFSVSSLSIGISLSFQGENQSQTIHPEITENSRVNDSSHLYTHMLSPREVSITSSISSNSCVFNMTLEHGLVNLPSLIAIGRKTLNAGTAATRFMIVAYTSFSFLILLAPCSVSNSIPFIPGIGSILYLLLVVPSLGIAMGFTELDKDAMTVVPMKNIKSESFSRDEPQKLAMYITMKGLVPAAFSQIIYLIAFGTLIIEFDSSLIVDECGSTVISWVDVLHCDMLHSYAGRATLSSGALVIAYHTLCMIAMSASFLSGTIPIFSKPTPLQKNKPWALTAIFGILIVVLYLSLTLESGGLNALPWYFYFLSLVSPLFCLAVCEIVKMQEKKHEERAAKMRRLQFETRLGMWSPK